MGEYELAGLVADSRAEVLAPVASRSRRVPLPWLIFFAAIGVAWLVFAPAFVADDSYFSLVVARNLGLHGQPTFSRLFLTNGFHPAWIASLGAYAWLMALVHRPLLDSAGAYAVLSFVFLLWGTANFVGAFKRLALDFGLPLTIMAGFLSVFATLGSEAHISYCALSCLALVATRGNESRWHPVLLGLAASFAFLARLDSVFILPPLYLWYLYQSRSWRKVFVSGLTLLAVTGPYLVYNQVAFGSIEPISGWLKSSFPHLDLKGVALSGVASCAFGYNVLVGLIPLAAAVWIVAACWKQIWSHPSRPIIVVFVIAACLHALYMALFYTSDLSWYWYYVLPMTAFALSLGLLFERWAEAGSQTRLKGYLVGVVCLLSVLAMVGRISRDHWGEEHYLGPQRAGLIELVDGFPAGSAVILYDGPGAVAFYSPQTRIVQVDMLMANRRMVDQMVTSGNALQFLIDLIRRRGVSSIYLITEPGDRLLQPDRDLNHLTFRNPKGTMNNIKIGEMETGPPLRSLAYPGGHTIYVWQVAGKATVTVPKGKYLQASREAYQVR